MTADVRAVTCREVVDFLGAYVAEELGRRERETFEAHVAGCEECAAFLREYRGTIELVRSAWDDPAVDEGIPEPLVRAIVAARERGP